MKHRPALVLPLVLLISCLGGRASAQVQGSADSAKVDTTQSDSLTISGKRYRSTFDSEVKYNAKDSIRVDLKGRKVFLYGDAHMEYQDLKVNAGIIIIDFRENTLVAIPFTDSLGRESGIPQFSDKDDNYQAKEIRYHFKSKRGIIKDLITSIEEGLVKGQTVKKDEYDNLYIRDARYTTCNDTSDPHFYIRADRMKVIPKKKIVSGPAFLYVEDVPTPAFLPFGYFPITNKRSSGILIPNYGYSSDRGYFLRNGGYYFGFSNYMDLALTGDIYANLSWRANATTSYARRYRFNGNLSLEYARNKSGEPEDLEYSVVNSYLIRWRHAMDPKARPNTNFNANVNFGSSNYLRLNSYNTEDIVQNTMQSSINYSKVFGGGKSSLTLAMNHEQNTRTKTVNLTIPNITFDVARFFPFRSRNYSGTGRWYEEIGLNYQARFNNRISTYDSLLGSADFTKQLQYGIHQRLPMAANFKMLKYVNFSPGANFETYSYLTSTRKSWSVSEQAIKTDTTYGFVQGYSYDVYAGFSTILYGMYGIRGKNVEAVRHVLTPSLSFNYRPDFSEQRYGFYREVQSDSLATKFEKYSIFEKGVLGGPGSGEVGSISLNLGNNLEMKVKRHNDTAKKTEKIKIFDFLNLGASYNFLAEEFQLSNIGINSQTTLFNQLVIQTSAIIDPYALDTGLLRKNEFEWNETRSVGRLVSGSFIVNTSFNSESLKKDKRAQAPRPITRNPYLTSEELALLNMPGGFVDFNIPWNFSLSYIFNYSKPGYVSEASKVSNLNFSGDFSLTTKWKIGFSSGYDFKNKNVSLTTIDVYRDLHCWEFRFNWMPFGERRYFNFGLNAKASVLQDLKLNRRRDWYDR